MRTLVDCGCETKVHADGSGAEMYFCPLHAAAPELLEALEVARQLILDEWGAGTYCKGTRVEEEFSQIEAAIRKAKGE